MLKIVLLSLIVGIGLNALTIGEVPVQVELNGNGYTFSTCCTWDLLYVSMEQFGGKSIYTRGGNGSHDYGCCDGFNGRT